MDVRGYLRGNPVSWDAEAHTWRYASDGVPVDPDTANRPCPQCGEPPTADGYDACLGAGVAGATGACCGHGVHPGYVTWPGVGAPPEWWRRAYVGQETVAALQRDAEVPLPNGPVPLLPLPMVAVYDPSFGLT